MAVGKKSFLLYTDVLHTVTHLTNEQAGELFKHLLAYVNDENPVTENPLVKIAFEPIKQALKRDLQKYEDIREKKRLAGLASAEKRKQNKHKSTPVKNVQHNLTDSTVNDNVNDSVNDILLEKETKELFDSWINYRKEIKKPIKSDKTKISLAKRMVKEGFEKSRQVINNSIENAYQGLFWDNVKLSKEFQLKDDNKVYFYWKHEGIQEVRSVDKQRAEKYFEKQKGGGYIAVIIDDYEA